MTRFLQLSDAAICLLGMPDTPPYLFGLVPVKRRHHGWLLQVVEPWRLQVVTEVLRNTPVQNAQIRRTILSRLGGLT